MCCTRMAELCCATVQCRWEEQPLLLLLLLL